MQPPFPPPVWLRSPRRFPVVRVATVAGLLLVVATIGLAVHFFSGNGASPASSPPAAPPSNPPVTPPVSPPVSPPASSGVTCRGTGACITAEVTYIVDGDTLDLGGTRIRLALVNSPEVGDPGADAATAFTAATCPVSSTATVDQDDGQLGGSYGRMIGVVWCGGTNLNAALLDSGNAALVSYYCSVSEFADESWTGCGY